MSTRAFYGASPIKRYRRTRTELGAIDRAIITAVAADAPVTLRGVYYRAVAAGAVEKTEDAYRLVGRQLLKLRRAGEVDYADITDGTRWVSRPRTWGSITSLLENTARSYRRALWADQDAEVHVFTEKDAVSGVIIPVTDRWDVPLGVLRGYASESFCWSVARSILASGKPTICLYQLGDHDPSGVDAWRSFRDTIAGFLGAWRLQHPAGEHAQQQRSEYMFAAGREHRRVSFERLAVTEQQITAWALPTRPTKRTDSRAPGFGDASVEVDAIPAATLRQLVDDAIVQHIDMRALHATRLAERSERDILCRLASEHSS